MSQSVKTTSRSIGSTTSRSAVSSNESTTPRSFASNITSASCNSKCKCFFVKGLPKNLISKDSSKLSVNPSSTYWYDSKTYFPEDFKTQCQVDYSWPSNPKGMTPKVLNRSNTSHPNSSRRPATSPAQSSGSRITRCIYCHATSCRLESCLCAKKLTSGPKIGR